MKYIDDWSDSQQKGKARMGDQGKGESTMAMMKGTLTW